MDTTAITARTVPALHQSLELVSDAELLDGVRRLVGSSNQLLADLLAHLAEVEARGIHRTRACSSLYNYCIYELRFSEDEAYRRVAAARLARRFPALLVALAAGELHLTGLLLLGPHLTEANLAEVLRRAKYRSKREILRLVRILNPLPAVPACIEPLGPAPVTPARANSASPTWSEQMQALCPVRELTAGERPSDWTNGANDAASRPEPQSKSKPESELRAPERYKVQFTANEDYVRLVEEAKALLSHVTPNLTLDELHLRALQTLVKELRKKKYATAQLAVSRVRDDQQAEGGPKSASVASAGEVPSESPRAERPSPKGEANDTVSPRRRGRHIPAAVRRAVFVRDGHRCSYVEPGGRRCAETHRLEFHHLTPFAAGGAHTASNLTLRCAAHNALAAEEDFGRELVERRRGSPLSYSSAAAEFDAGPVREDGRPS